MYSSTVEAHPSISQELGAQRDEQQTLHKKRKSQTDFVTGTGLGIRFRLIFLGNTKRVLFPTMPMLKQPFFNIETTPLVKS